MNGIGKSTIAAAVIAALALAACSGKDPDQKSETPTEAPPSQNRVLLDAAERPLEKAHEVEDISAARKGELDRQIEASE